MARWSDVAAMFENIANYVRRNKAELYWADSPGECHRICASSGQPSWEITPASVHYSGRTGKGLDLALALGTFAGKQALLKSLNAVKNLPPFKAPTSWERLLRDD